MQRDLLGPKTPDGGGGGTCVSSVVRCPVRLCDSTLEFPIIKTTKLLIETRSGTRAKRIY